MSLGKKIKQIRLERGETLEEFGKHFGANRSNASNWELERNKPNPERLKAIADLAGITVDELLDDTCMVLEEWGNDDYSILWFETDCGGVFIVRDSLNYEYCPFCGRRVEWG